MSAATQPRQFATHPNFQVLVSADSRRVSFQFTVSGNKASGVVYVTRNVPEGCDWMAEAAKAARVCCKRCGAETCVLRNVCAPVR